MAIAAGGVCFLLLAVTGSVASAAVLVLLYYVCREAVIPLSDGLTFSHIGRHGGDYGRIRAWGSLGFVVSAALMAAVGAGAGGRVQPLFLFYALFCGAQLAGCLALPTAPPPEGAEGEGAPWHLLRGWTVWAFVFAAFIARASMMGYYSFFSLYLQQEIGLPGVGYLWALGPIAESPVIFFSGWIIRRIGLRGLMMLGLGAIAVRLTVYALTSSVLLIVAVQALHCLTFGGVHVATVTFVDRLLPSRYKATGQTVFAALIIGLGSLAGSSAAGALSDSYSFRTLYGVLGSTALLGLVAAAFLGRGGHGPIRSGPAPSPSA